VDGAAPAPAATIGPEGRLFAALGAFLFSPPRSPAAVLLALALAAGTLVFLRRVILRSRPAGKHVFRLAGRLEMGVLALLLLAMIVLSTLQIVLRNLFGVGLLWVDPLLRYATLWIGFLGAAVAAAEGRHIQIDVFTHALPPGLRRISGRIVSLAAAATCAILFVAAYRHLATEYTYDTRVFLDLPSWLLLAVIPLGLALLTYRFLDRAITLPPPAVAPAVPLAVPATADGNGSTAP
jgi:TRAP-type C4-dicarboxylate transport system permease small subunit